jgi:PHP family Zn ribbon phosphoesterase
MNPYDRISIQIGEYELTARPIDFIFENEEPKLATQYETTCPSCSNMIQFYPETKTSVQCPTCGYGKVISEVVRVDKLEVIESGQVIGRKKPIVMAECPFIDPVELGLFNFDI